MSDNSIPEETRPVMPLEDLITDATKDMGEFQDGSNGYSGVQYDSTSGVLTIKHDAGEPLSEEWKAENEFEDYRDTFADFVELGAVVRLVQKIMNAGRPAYDPDDAYPTEAVLDLIAEILDHGRLELHPGPIKSEDAL